VAFRLERSDLRRVDAGLAAPVTHEAKAARVPSLVLPLLICQIISKVCWHFSNHQALADFIPRIVDAYLIGVVVAISIPVKDGWTVAEWTQGFMGPQYPLVWIAEITSAPTGSHVKIVQN
jgi:hypothetical protein